MGFNSGFKGLSGAEICVLEQGISVDFEVQKGHCGSVRPTLITALGCQMSN